MIGIVEQAAPADDRATRALALSERRFHAVVSALAGGVIILRSSTDVLDANPSAQRILGVGGDELIGQLRWWERFDLAPQDGTLADLCDAIVAGGLTRDSLVWFTRADGERRLASLNSGVLADVGDGGEAEYLVSFDDVTDKWRAREALRQLANDNEQILSAAGEGIWRTDNQGLITFVNPAACRLLGVEPPDVLGRPAHDLMHHSYADGESYPIERCPINAVLRDGAVHRRDDEVFWRADGSSFEVDYTSAPIRADDEIVGAVCVFSDITQRKAHERELQARADCISLVARALEEERFLVYAQPIIDLSTGEMTREELLVRLRNEEGGIEAPHAFIPDAERFGPIEQIDRWMIGQAVMLAAAGRSVEVNLSARSLGSATLTDEISRLLREHGADPEKLVFEVTETAAAENFDNARAFAERLRGMGCRFALDDFGTGYGTLVYLRDLPTSFLKIDMRFVRNVVHDAADRRMVQSIVQVAHDHGQSTIAEGVEDRATLDLLRELGVDEAQGYYIGRPCPA
jgi:PAS domain S-box-containing protein